MSVKEYSFAATITLVDGKTRFLFVCSAHSRSKAMILNDISAKDSRMDLSIPGIERPYAGI